jgi:hypothetical protein
MCVCVCAYVWNMLFGCVRALLLCTLFQLVLENKVLLLMDGVNHRDVVVLNSLQHNNNYDIEITCFVRFVVVF